MSNLGLYQTAVEEMKKAGGPEPWVELIRQDGYNDGAHDMLDKLAIPLLVGLIFTGKQLYEIGKGLYFEAKEKRSLVKKAASEAEEKLIQLYEEETIEDVNENGGK